MFSFLSSFYILDISPVRCRIGEDIFPFCRLLFCLIDSVLCIIEAFQFQEVHLLIVGLSVCATGVIFRKCSPVPMCSRLLPTFSSIRLSVTGFMLRSLIHLDLSFVQCNRYEFICILLAASSNYEASFTLIPIPHKDAQRKNYRSISLMSIDAKILNKILTNLIQEHITTIVSFTTISMLHPRSAGMDQHTQVCQCNPPYK